MAEILSTTSDAECADAVAKAATIIRGGGIVAFPTETVYGLGANATNQDAVAKIFAAKGRPSNNPIIVHVADWIDARALVRDWTPIAEVLSGKYSAGPLTLVLNASPIIAPNVLAGGTTVGLRVPDHPIARAIIRAAGVPIAAPSANRSNELSPTTASAVEKSLGGRISFIVDGGPCRVGIESTVLDCTGPTPILLRPGTITVEELSAASGVPIYSQRSESRDDSALRSPGMLSRHYAPHTPFIVIDDGSPFPPESFSISFSPTDPASMTLPRDPLAAARVLYDVLRCADESGRSLIAMRKPPDSMDWAAVNDRIRRACGRGNTE